MHITHVRVSAFLKQFHIETDTHVLRCPKHAPECKISHLHKHKYENADVHTHTYTHTELICVGIKFIYERIYEWLGSLQDWRCTSHAWLT